MYKIGIDEAGRGPWLGPVVACAMTFNPENMPDKEFLDKLNDSKKLSKKKREELFKQLIEMSKGQRENKSGQTHRSAPTENVGVNLCVHPKVFFGVGIVDNFLIDEINIKQANKEAMRRALVELLRKIDEKKIKSVLVDGNDNYEFEELEKKPIFIIGGDAKIKEIGAASIIAKVFRDKLLKTYAKIYPDLGLENHKGYGTKKHKEALQKKSDITGIHRLSYKPVKKILEKKEKLLLHICCGPDATIPIMRLKNKYDITCFWYDPNIQPKKEYDKRFREFVKVCKIEKIPYIKGEYDVENFLKKIKGLENTPEKGEKCVKCYDLRLRRSALEAKKLGIKYWTTSLNISPHKSLESIYKIGNNLDKIFGLKFLEIDFKKQDGFNKSVEYCKTHNIYRQNYCGCIYSDTFPEKYKN